MKIRILRGGIFRATGRQASGDGRKNDGRKVRIHGIKDRRGGSLLDPKNTESIDPASSSWRRGDFGKARIDHTTGDDGKNLADHNHGQECPHPRGLLDLDDSSTFSKKEDE